MFNTENQTTTRDCTLIPNIVVVKLFDYLSRLLLYIMQNGKQIRNTELKSTNLRNRIRFTFNERIIFKAEMRKEGLKSFIIDLTGEASLIGHKLPINIYKWNFQNVKNFFSLV